MTRLAKVQAVTGVRTDDELISYRCPGEFIAGGPVCPVGFAADCVSCWREEV